jgi:hypothetical protein
LSPLLGPPPDSSIGGSKNGSSGGGGCAVETVVSDGSELLISVVPGASDCFAQFPTPRAMSGYANWPLFISAV